MSICSLMSTISKRIAACNFLSYGRMFFSRTCCLVEATDSVLCGVGDIDDAGVGFQENNETPKSLSIHYKSTLMFCFFWGGYHIGV